MTTNSKYFRKGFYMHLISSTVPPQALTSTPCGGEDNNALRKELQRNPFFRIRSGWTGERASGFSKLEKLMPALLEIFWNGQMTSNRTLAPPTSAPGVTRCSRKHASRAEKVAPISAWEGCAAASPGTLDAGNLVCCECQTKEWTRCGTCQQKLRSTPNRIKCQDRKATFHISCANIPRTQRTKELRWHCGCREDRNQGKCSVCRVLIRSGARRRACGNCNNEGHIRCTAVNRNSGKCGRPEPEAQTDNTSLPSSTCKECKRKVSKNLPGLNAVYATSTTTSSVTAALEEDKNRRRRQSGNVTNACKCSNNSNNFPRNLRCIKPRPSLLKRSWKSCSGMQTGYIDMWFSCKISCTNER